MHRAILICALVLLAPATHAEQAPAEIEYLLTQIGSSGCTFIRNGKEHSAEDAEDHLRMKYRRGKRYADTTENFIDRLASKSSISKKLYMIECPGEAPVSTGSWLHSKLDSYRSAE